MTTQLEQDVTDLLSMAARIVRNSACPLDQEVVLIGPVLQALVLHEAADKGLRDLGAILNALERR